MKSTKRQIGSDLYQLCSSPTTLGMCGGLFSTLWRWESLLHTNCARSAGAELTPTLHFESRDDCATSSEVASRPSRATGGITPAQKTTVFSSPPGLHVKDILPTPRLSCVFLSWSNLGPASSSPLLLLLASIIYS
ncbi:unnamed protein product [Pleuronectes platessa]|uniref:Uncharacterized protein n=1 Tax=Pleuronectes platessa TaxID=8262 RepID=A0A9N7UB09_PLEPL|nr:unnamed protein product [Pleuronectes platessa]